MITHDLNTTGVKSCCVIARELIANGADPEQTIEFIRGTTPVFHEKPLSHWAGRTVEESSNGKHMRFRKYRPQDGA